MKKINKENNIIQNAEYFIKVHFPPDRANICVNQMVNHHVFFRICLRLCLNTIVYE